MMAFENESPPLKPLKIHLNVATAGVKPASPIRVRNEATPRLPPIKISLRKSNDASPVAADPRASSLFPHGAIGASGVGAARAKRVVTVSVVEEGGRLVCVRVNATDYRVNDFVYLEAGVHGESFYVARIVSFAKAPTPTPTATLTSILTNTTLTNTSHVTPNDALSLNNNSSNYVSEEMPADKIIVYVNWWLRRSEVPAFRRGVGDHRMLFATMHSDTNPITALRGHCNVSHTRHIIDMEAFRADDDNFYYSQLYDRYTQRFYDVVPIETVKNMPASTLEKLQNYAFILVEEGLKDHFMYRHDCPVCKKACATTELAVTCSLCKESFHMPCIGLRKLPPRGFAWECHSCTSKALALKETEVSGQLRSSSSISVGVISKPNSDLTKLDKIPGGRVDRNRRTAARGDPSRPQELAVLSYISPRPFKFDWPFRYYSERDVQFDNVIDEEVDKGYPRAFTRIGSRFQARIPALTSSITPTDGVGPSVLGTFEDISNPPNNDMAMNQINSVKPNSVQKKMKDKRANRSRRWKSELDEVSLDQIRGTDQELTFKCPDGMEARVDEYMRTVKDKVGERHVNTDVLDKAISELAKANYNFTAALSNFSKLENVEMGVVQWDEEEVELFERGLVRHNFDLAKIAFSLPDKTRREITNFFFIWKKTSRSAPIKKQVYDLYHGGRKPRREQDHDDFEDEVVSESEHFTDESEQPECQNCFCTDATRWKLKPGVGNVEQEFWCSDCFDYFLKYNIPKPLPEEFRKLARERARAVMKRKRDEEVGGYGYSYGEEDSNDEPTRKRRGGRNQIRRGYPSRITEYEQDYGDPSFAVCAVCLDSKIDAGAKMWRCSLCRLAVHEDCYGIREEMESKDTVSEGDSGSASHSLRSGRRVQTWSCSKCKNAANPAASTTYKCCLCTIDLPPTQSPLIRTIGNNWVHVMCALFVEETRFGKVTWEPVEGVGQIVKEKWQHICDVCKVPGGIARPCAVSACEKRVHVTCAQRYNSEIKIFEQDGLFVPLVFCDEHSAEARDKTVESLYNSNRTKCVSDYIALYKRPHTLATLSQSTTLLHSVAPKIEKTIVIPPLQQQKGLGAVVKTEPGLHIAVTDPVEVHQCAICNTAAASTRWWQWSQVFGEGSLCPEALVCHKCYCEAKDMYKDESPAGVSTAPFQPLAITPVTMATATPDLVPSVAPATIPAPVSVSAPLIHISRPAPTYQHILASPLSQQMPLLQLKSIQMHPSPHPAQQQSQVQPLVQAHVQPPQPDEQPREQAQLLAQEQSAHSTNMDTSE